MFFYLYDAFVRDKKYTDVLQHIEARIIELGINGRVERLTPPRNLKEIIDTALKQDARSIIIVGSDATWLRAMNILAEHPIPLGLIPLGPSPSLLAPLFGITNKEEACNILSRRIIKILPLGKANQNFFLNTVEASIPRGTHIRCNDRFSLDVQREAKLVVHNLLPPQHGIEIDIEPQGSTNGLWHRSIPQMPTRLTVRKIIIKHPEHSLPFTLDGITTIKSPITISLKPKALKVIVGKQRLLV